MTASTISLLGALVGLVGAALTLRLARQRQPHRAVRVLAALAIGLAGAALVPAAVQLGLPLEVFAPEVQVVARRALWLGFAAAAVGAIGAGLLVVGRGGAGIVAGLAVWSLAARRFMALLAWSVALWGRPVLEPRGRFALEFGVLAALGAVLLAGGITARIAGARKTPTCRS